MAEVGDERAIFPYIVGHGYQTSTPPFHGSACDYRFYSAIMAADGSKFTLLINDRRKLPLPEELVVLRCVFSREVYGRQHEYWVLVE